MRASKVSFRPNMVNQGQDTNNLEPRSGEKKIEGGGGLPQCGLDKKNGCCILFFEFQNKPKKKGVFWRYLYIWALVF